MRIYVTAPDGNGGVTCACAPTQAVLKFVIDGFTVNGVDQQVDGSYEVAWVKWTDLPFGGWPQDTCWNSCQNDRGGMDVAERWANATGTSWGYRAPMVTCANSLYSCAVLDVGGTSEMWGCTGAWFEGIRLGVTTDINTLPGWGDVYEPPLEFYITGTISLTRKSLNGVPL